MPPILLPENFINAPMISLLTKEPWHLSVENIIDLAKKLNDFVETATSESMLESNILYWINIGLHYAVKNESSIAVEPIAKIIYKIAAKDPSTLIIMLSKINESIYFNGQNSLFVWLDELYTSTFSPKNITAIISINLALTRLLESPNIKLTELLIKNNNSGVGQGENCIILLTQAILQSGSIPHNQSETLLITDLLAKFLLLYPDITVPVLTQEITFGNLKDKTIIYMLARSLENPAKDNPAVVKIICNILNDAIKSKKKADLLKSLFNVIGSGPYKEAHPFYIILKSLLSAAYINKNEQVITDITSFITNLFEVAPEEMGAAISTTITKEYEGSKNGIAILVQALMAALDHDIKTAAIDNLLSILINSNSEIISRAFTQKFIQYGEINKSPSPLELLVNRLKVDVNRHNLERIMTLITELAVSDYAIPMILSLPLNIRAIFIEEFSKAHNPTEEMLTLLSETKCEDFDPLAIFSEGTVKAVMK